MFYYFLINMSSSIFVTGGIVAAIYILIRFLEMRFIIKQNKPLKTLTRDALLVYFSVIGGDFILKQVQPLSDGLNDSVTAFTNQPDF